MKKKVLWSILLSIITIIPVVIVLYYTIIFSAGFKISETNNINWYTKNDIGEEINIKDINDDSFNYDDSIIIYSDNIKDINIEYLGFYTESNNIEVKINNKQIYTYNNDNLIKDTIKYNLHIFELPIIDEDYKIKIKLDDVYSLEGLFIRTGSENYIKLSFFQDNIKEVSILMSFVFINMVNLFLFILFIKLNYKVIEMFILYLLNILVTLNYYGNSNIYNLININNNLIRLSYYCMLVFGLLFMLYIRCISDNPRQKKISNICSLLFIPVFGISLLIEFFNLIDYSYFIIFIYLIVISEIILAMIFIKSKIKDKKDNSLNKMNILILFLFTILLFLEIYNILTKDVYTYTILDLISNYLFIIFVINIYINSLVKLINKIEISYNLENELKDTRNLLIQSQMRPHFIFNTLGAIRSMIKSSPDDAYDLTAEFSKYLRSNIIGIDPRKKIPFRQELDHIEVYTNIEKKRFNDRINIVYNLSVVDFYIPPLTVEPLVENAVKYGICKKIHGGTITLSTKENKDYIYIIVEDDGVGFDVNILETDVKKNSVGIEYVKIRLEELVNGSLEIKSKIGEGTKATITLNKKYLDEEF